MRKAIFRIISFCLILYSISILSACDYSPQPTPTKEPIETYGFEYCWYRSFKRARVYHIFNPSSHCLIVYTYSSKSPSTKYHMYQTEGSLSTGLYTIQEGEKSHIYYKVKSNQYYEIDGRSTNMESLCSKAKVEDVIKMLRENTDFPDSYVSSIKSTK